MNSFVFRRRLALAASVIGLICVTAASADDFRIEPGFVPLFNGKDFSGWQFGKSYGLPETPPKNWKVDGGVIKLSGGGRPNLGSQWDYDDFDMRFQWRAMRTKYNSGFYIRSRRKVGNNQINLAKGGEGRFFGGKMKGGKAVPELQKPAKEWNDWRVRVVGDTVKFWCNGKLAWEGTEFQSKRGHLGLQAEGAPLEFRRLRIKEIGWESLNDPKKWRKADEKQWKSGNYGRVFSPDGIARANPDEKPADYVLRLEWKSAKSRAAQIGIINDTRLTVVRIGDPNGVVVKGVKPGDSVDNPPGQWNYMQLTLSNGKLTVWQNGRDLVKDYDTAKGRLVDGGFIILRATDGGIQFRNMRAKAIKH
ncbi:MAG: family 16 glycoside hydrolase [Planctomycetaceae bacterium]